MGTPELLIILVVVLLVFGGTKLPQLARNMGQAKKEFEKIHDEPATGEATRDPRRDQA